VGLAIVVSGVVCFVVARYLARPLQRVRDASYRLAAGDLHARAGPSVGTRHDEIGDLVRDFDAMAARIETLVDSHNQLLSDISHELRSPLARLNVALELARRKAGADARADLDRIEAEAERMNELIGRVLALARAKHHRPTLTAPVDIGGIVRQVTRDADYEAQQQHKSVVLDIRVESIIGGDAQLIASAVENVLRNGLRYSPERSTVDVTVDGADNDTVITVRDHGPGVPAPELQRIFSPFHRVELARNRDTGGVGLGLAIAQRAIAVHGGSITAENASDGGLRVTIRLPRDHTAVSHA
jgi:two-component system sensor histidine kinase CpxA